MVRLVIWDAIVPIMTSLQYEYIYDLYPSSKHTTKLMMISSSKRLSKINVSYAALSYLLDDVYITIIYYARCRGMTIH